MTSARRNAVVGAAIFLAAVPIAGAGAQTVRGLEGFGTPAAVQTPTQIQLQTPAPSATAVPIPAAPRIDLPTATSAPEALRKPRTQTNRTPPAHRAAPERPVAVATPRAAPSPTPVAVPTIAPTPVPPLPSAPSGPPVAAVTPTAVPTVAPTGTAPLAMPPATGPDTGGWLIATGIVALLVGILWLMSRRKRADAEPEAATIRPRPMAAPDPIPADVSTASAAMVMSPVSGPRARLSARLRPIRAGLNMLSATAECEITVTNTGDVAAEAIRVGVRLLGAHAGQEAELADAVTQPIMRTAVPPFALAPGESRSLKVVSALSRAAMPPVTAGGRPMFVPLVAVNLLYATGAGAGAGAGDGDGDGGQTAQAFAIGIERVDSAKLSPLWLDQPPRMHDTVAARPHAGVVER